MEGVAHAFHCVFPRRIYTPFSLPYTLQNISSKLQTFSWGCSWQRRAHCDPAALALFRGRGGTVQQKNATISWNDDALDGDASGREEVTLGLETWLGHLLGAQVLYSFLLFWSTCSSRFHTRTLIGEYYGTTSYSFLSPVIDTNWLTCNLTVNVPLRSKVLVCYQKKIYSR